MCKYLYSTYCGVVIPRVGFWSGPGSDKVSMGYFGDGLPLNVPAYLDIHLVDPTDEGEPDYNPVGDDE
jgi:hypothetical protein